MKYISKKEFIFLLILLIAAFCVVNPLHLWMPHMLHMIFYGVLFVCAGLFIHLFIYQKTQDEREKTHELHASALSYSLGLVSICVVLMYQLLTDTFDYKLVIILLIMIFAHSFSRVYSRIYK